ncbi:hypothetical protein PACTADRAFT_2395 [Pachysolen tannophilus NRRL Y-2460]|uniref:Anaphase-promoting complex subunit 4 WD40 domain-containing protein n=1 Tax=Pachysolen tannophilus NRRL Y-2460 TaxID=669874 RepID=A0A1E4TWG1_PACTA|nr:hypothetical protein PACTADRAFT_2395 [Pachysolen tannophilus NRRL Y-2460]
MSESGENSVNKPIQFRIIVGSYEHNLLCLSLILNKSLTPIFQPIFHFQAHSLSIRCVDAAKRYLVSGGNDEHIKIYDLQKRKELGTLLSHSGSITTLEFSSEAPLKDQSSKLDNKDNLEKSGKWLLSGSDDGNIIIWRTKDWEIFGTLKGHTARVNDLAIHPSGRVAVSVSDDKTIKLWNLMTAKKASTLKMKGKDTLGQSGQFVEWSKNGNEFVVGLLNKILIYQTTNAKIFKFLKFKSTLMKLLIAVIDNVEYLITAHNNGSIIFNDLKSILNLEDEEIDLDSLTPGFKLVGHSNRVKDFRIYEDHQTSTKFLISISSDGKIVVWDLSIKDQVAVYDTGERLNCCCVVSENVEKFDSMKRRYEEANEEGENAGGIESEYETDGEEIKKIMNGNMNSRQRKKNKKHKMSKVTVELE